MVTGERAAAVAAMRTLETYPAPVTPPNEITIGDYVFANKNQASKTTRAIIQSVARNGMTTDAQAFFRALVENHPNIRDKIGDRPYYVEPVGTRSGTASKNTGLLLRYADIPDWKTDRAGYRRFVKEYDTFAIPIGIDACLGVKTHIQKVKAAARMIVARQVAVEPYGHQVEQSCAMCGDVVVGRALHWDHHPHGFVDIFREWRIQMLLLWEDIAIDRLNLTRFADEELVRSWESFHQHHARYRPACNHCNIMDKEREPLILSEEDWQAWLRQSQ